MRTRRSEEMVGKKLRIFPSTLQSGVLLSAEIQESFSSGGGELAPVLQRNSHASS